MREQLSGEQWWLARLRLKHLVRTKTELRRKGSRHLGVEDRIVSRELLSRYNREELHDKVWAQLMRTLAKNFGISDVGLAKVCKRLFISMPGRGYWAKKAAGRRVPSKPALLPIQLR
jgi:hypothetical protein